MVLLVPFDGSDLSTAALHRAAEFSEYTEESVLALSIVPEEPDYAIERGWIDEGDPFTTPRPSGSDCATRSRPSRPPPSSAVRSPKT